MGLSPRRRVLAVLVACSVAVGGLLGGIAAAQGDAVMRGIRIGGIPLSGLERADVISKLRPAANSVEERRLSLVAGEKVLIRRPRDLGIALDVRTTAEQALEAGRGNPLHWISRTLWARSTQLSWALAVDRDKLSRSLDEIAEEVLVDASNGSVRFAGGQVVVVPPTEGIALRRGDAERALIAAVLDPSKNGRVHLPVTVVEPRIGADDVARVEAQARRILSGPVKFSLEGREIILSEEDVAAGLRVRVISDPEQVGRHRLVLQADPEVLEQRILDVARWVHRPSRNASFAVEGDRVRVIPAEAGRTLDSRSAAEGLMRQRASESPSVIELRTRSQAPAFTTEAAQALGIQERVSTFTTRFDPRNSPRVSNIDLMASAIDGTIVRPGEVFSLNSNTGPRTPERGYKEAQVIVNGELVPGIGGGVCQVGTTVFNAVFLAGLPIAERSNHSLYISAYPLGRDATVNYGYQDLKFRNDTPFGLLLKASVSTRALTVSLYSSPLGRTVELSTSERRNFREPETKYIDDPTLPAGEEVEVEPGIQGFDVHVTRVVRQGTDVLHSSTFVSKYRPWKRIVRRGTGPAPPPPSPEPESP